MRQFDTKPRTRCEAEPWMGQDGSVLLLKVDLLQSVQLALRRPDPFSRSPLSRCAHMQEHMHNAAASKCQAFKLQ